MTGKEFEMLRPQEPCIPVAEIIEWQRAEADELTKKKVKMEARRSRMGQETADNHPSMAFELGQIAQADALLNSFSAFIIAHAADQTGELKKILNPEE